MKASQKSNALEVIKKEQLKRRVFYAGIQSRGSTPQKS
jgi:hypothetical protein